MPLLADWQQRGTAPSALDASAVTPGLREWYADGDDEELEWAAQTLAARSSLRLLNVCVDGPFRRVVIAADVDDADVLVLDGVERASVRLGTPVGTGAWAAILVDADSDQTVIRRAAAAIALADHGDDDAAFVVSEADDAELLWYSVDEISGLLG